jgi:hypothetical protein
LFQAGAISSKKARHISVYYLMDFITIQLSFSNVTTAGRLDAAQNIRSYKQLWLVPTG